MTTKRPCLFHKRGKPCQFSIVTDGVVSVNGIGFVTGHAPTVKNPTLCLLSGCAGYYTGDKRLCECMERKG